MDKFLSKLGWEKDKILNPRETFEELKFKQKGLEQIENTTEKVCGLPVFSVRPFVQSVQKIKF